MPSFLTPQQMSFTLGQVLLNLLLAFALSYLAGFVYRRMNDGPAFSYSFFVTLLVTPVVVCMIMMAIGSNVALSLGLVGALSIVRFRTVIKDSRDMAFLFLMIGIGLCSGSGAYGVALLGTVFACGVLWVIHRVTFARFASGEYLLVFRSDEGPDGQADQLLGDMVSWRRLHGATDLGDEGCEFTYRVRLGDQTTPELLLSRLRSVEGLSHSTLISPESQLAL